MNTAERDASPALALGMIQSIAEAICDRPGDTAAQRAIRSRAVVETVQGFQPCDPVEIMLAGMAVTHAHLVVDAARDVFRGQDDRLRARTCSMIVALGRGMFGCLKELHIAQARRHKIEAAANPEPEAVASVEVSPAPAGPVDKVAATPAKPITPSAATGTPAATKPPAPREPPLPPLRHAETSVTAAFAVLSPPVPRYAVSALAKQHAGAPPSTFPVGSPATSAQQPRTMPPEPASNHQAVAERRAPAEAARAA